MPSFTPTAPPTGAARQLSPRSTRSSPTPELHRPALERLFREQLAPELESIHADLSAAPWHFTTQAPLSSVPAVADALDLLGWTLHPLPLERVGQLLLSPFFAHTDAPELRARFEIGALRRSPGLRHTLDLAGFTAFQNARRSSRPGLQAAFPELHALAKAAEKAGLLSGKRSHADWTEGIRRLLKTVGWPGPRALSPAEFRAVEAWEKVLDLLATLQIHSERVSFATVLDLLRTEVRTAPAPSIFPEAPVQVLDFAEAEALCFDLTVVLGATDRNLPTPERPHPLLPQGLQRTLGVGDPLQAVARTRGALESLAQRSGRIFLLASPTADDGEAQLTPLAAPLGFAITSPSDVLAAEIGAQPLGTELALEVDPLPPLPAHLQ